MLLAEVIVDGNFATYAQEALFFLVLVGGVTFLLAGVIAGQNPPSSSPSRRKQSLPNKARSLVPPLPGPAAHVQDSASPKNKRRSLRRGGHRVAVLVADALVPSDSVAGLVLDRSRGGLCLLVPRKVDVGKLLAVRTASFPESLASVGLRVRHCQQTNKGFRLGCQFVDELPWSTVLLFG